VSNRLHLVDTPPQESIIPPPPNQSTTQILPTIIEGVEHLTFEDIPEMRLHQPINTSTEMEPSHSTATSSQATIGAPHQPPPRAPSPIHEAEEDEAAVEEEELARVQQEIERLQQEQESILRRQATMQHA
jgi:hypothetical protein